MSGFSRLLERYHHLDYGGGPVVSEPSPQQVWPSSVWYQVSALVNCTNNAAWRPDCLLSCRFSSKGP